MTDEQLVTTLRMWAPELDDRTEELLLVEAGRRESADWNRGDAENVIAFLLSQLDESNNIFTYLNPYKETLNEYL